MQGLSALVARDGLLAGCVARRADAVEPRRGRQPQQLPTGCGDPERRRCDTARPQGGGRLLRPHLGGAVARHQRHCGGKPDFVNTTLDRRGRGALHDPIAPGQDPDTIAATAEKLVRAAMPAEAEVELIRGNSAPPGVFAPDSQAIQLGMEAFESAIGVRPILVRVGGTLPIYPALAAKGIPTIGTGLRPTREQRALAERAPACRGRRPRGRCGDRAVPGLAALG